MNEWGTAQCQDEAESTSSVPNSENFLSLDAGGVKFVIVRRGVYNGRAGRFAPPSQRC